MSVHIKLPKALLDLKPEEREQVLQTIAHALKLPKEQKLPKSASGSEHNMWSTNGDPLLGDIEDEFYRSLFESCMDAMASVFAALDLPTEVDMAKALTPAYMEYEELIKAKDSGRNRISDLIELSKTKKDNIMKWVDDGKALTKEQLKKLDSLLSSKLPNYGKLAERFILRAGFAGKARGKADTEGIDLAGAIALRYPETVQAARKEGVVLTLREKKRAEQEGRKVEVLPLTPYEVRAIEHAELHCADKITEIGDRHRSQIKQMVIRAKKERWSAQKLAQELFDTFGDQNRDWRRVAITELAFASNDAFLAGCEEGDRVIGMGSADACPKCRAHIIGKEFTVLAEPPKQETYDTDMNYLWVGKTNYGRRAAEMRACIPYHPNCRCRAHKISRFYKVDKDGKLVLKDAGELINEERKKRGLDEDPNIGSMSLEEMSELALRKLQE